jgi:hypothetical protein
MDFVVIIVCIFIGLVMGWKLREYHAMKTVHSFLKEIEEHQEKEIEERTKMRLERHNGLIYAFADEDDSFIAQGKDLEDLDKAIIARFPGKKFAVQEQNLIDIKAEYHEPV